MELSTPIRSYQSIPTNEDEDSTSVRLTHEQPLSPRVKSSLSHGGVSLTLLLGAFISFLAFSGMTPFPLYSSATYKWNSSRLYNTAQYSQELIARRAYVELGSLYDKDSSTLEYPPGMFMNFLSGSEACVAFLQIFRELSATVDFQLPYTDVISPTSSSSDPEIFPPINYFLVQESDVTDEAFTVQLGFSSFSGSNNTGSPCSFSIAKHIWQGFSSAYSILHEYQVKNERHGHISHARNHFQVHYIRFLSLNTASTRLLTTNR